MARFVTSKFETRREVMLMSDDNETETTPEELHREKVLCACVMETLQRFFPGHPWMVRCAGGGEAPNGRKKAKAIEIKIPILMGNKSYVIPVPMLCVTENQSSRLIMRAGGEILERFNIPRAAFTTDPFLMARANEARKPVHLRSVPS